MILRRMDDKLEELKAYFSSKFSEQEDILTKTFKNIIDDLKEEIMVQIQNKVSKQSKEIASENKMV